MEMFLASRFPLILGVLLIVGWFSVAASGSHHHHAQPHYQRDEANAQAEEMQEEGMDADDELVVDDPHWTHFRALPVPATNHRQSPPIAGGDKNAAGAASNTTTQAPTSTEPPPPGPQPPKPQKSGEKKKCVSGITRCATNEDCGADPGSKSFLQPQCLGTQKEMCDCTACPAYAKPCNDELDCGGLKNSCYAPPNTKLQKTCNCLRAAELEWNNEANYNETVKKPATVGLAISLFCAQAKCVGQGPDACRGLPCRGRCYYCPL